MDKSGIFHKLADVVFPEDEDGKTPAPVTTTEVVLKPGIKRMESSAVAAVSITPEPPDPKVREALEQVLKGKGDIYILFMEMMSSFRDIIPDEGQRYRAAFVATQKTCPDLSMDSILKALDERAQALESGRQKFLESLDAQIRHIAEIEKELEAKKEQITKLKEAENELNVSISQEREKVTRVQRTFESALAEVQKDIMESREVIQKHLQERK